jgi:taurine dioxygenase
MRAASALLDRMIRPDIVYHHVWRKGDVLVIDDRATMHRAHGDYDPSQSRVLLADHRRGRSPSARLA